MKEVAKIEFREAITGDETFIMVRAVEGYVNILLTSRHSGDVDVSLASSERDYVVKALEEAVSIAQSADPLKSSSVNEDFQDIGAIRAVYPDSKLESVVTISVKDQLVILDLALEGLESEQDERGVYLTTNQCKWLIEVLRSVELTA
jgi:hypothetical protein